jgi:VWFA-related protein
MLKRELYITLGLLAFAAFNLALPHPAQTQSTCSPEQRKELVLTAVDNDGGVVDKLRAEQLSLKVGGSPATISDLIFHTKAPLDVAVLIDASVSQESVLPTAKAAARAFTSSVPTQGQDRVAVVSFSDKPYYVQALTSDFSNVATAIDQIKLEVPPGYIGGGVVVSARPPTSNSPLSGSTSLWDVVASATTELFAAKAENRRRAVLLFSDGVDTSSSDKLSTTIDEAIKRDVPIFSIGLGYSESSVEERQLKRLSEQSGGVAYFPGKKKEKLEAALNEIARRLRGNYVVGYCGGAAKDRAKIQLEIVDPELRKAKPVLAYKRY